MDVPLIFWCPRFTGGSQSGEFLSAPCSQSNCASYWGSILDRSGAGRYSWGSIRDRSEFGYFWYSSSHGRMQ